MTVTRPKILQTAILRHGGTHMFCISLGTVLYWGEKSDPQLKVAFKRERHFPLMSHDRGCTNQNFFCLYGLHFHKHVVLEKTFLHKEA